MYLRILLTRENCKKFSQKENVKNTELRV